MRAENEEIRVLYVDDEPTLLEVTREFLQMDGGIMVETSADAREALGTIGRRRFDVIISDYQMPVMDGLSFLKAVREKGEIVPFILFTGKGREDVAIQALNNGADFYLQKGGDPVVQFKELRHIIKQLNMRSEAERLVTTREEQLQMLHTATKQLYATLDLDAIYRTMQQFVGLLMDCDGFVVSSYSARDRMLTCRYSWNEGRAIDISAFPPRPLDGQGVQSVAIRSGQAMIVPNELEGERTAVAGHRVTDERANTKVPSEGRERTRSALVVPLKHEGEVIGVVEVNSSRRDAFSEEDLRLLESLASHASAAISIASYYNQMKFETAERSRAESLTNLYRNIVMSMREGFVLGRCVHSNGKMNVMAVIMNPSAAEVIGVPVEECMGVDISGRLGRKYGVDLAAHCERVMRTGETATVPGSPGEGRYGLKLFPLGNDCVGIVLDR